MAGKTIQDQTSTYPDQNLTKFLNVEPVDSITVPGPSGSVVIDGSQVSIPGFTADTAVLAYTASTAPSYLPLVGGTITGNLTVNGTTTFNNLVVNTSSYSSGSTVFGDALTDTHQFTGSVFITGSSLTWNNSTLIASDVTSSMSVASSSYASQAENSSTIDINIFAAPVDSYLLMSNVAGTTGVAIGGDADLRYNTITNVLTVSNISATTLTGSLLGTASNAVSALTASFYEGSITSASYALTASRLLGTASNALSALTASKLFVTNLAIDPGTYYPMFANTTFGPANLFADAATYTYQPSTNILTVTASSAFTASYVAPYETAWTSYTPTWTTDGTQPTLGDGSITGAYKLIGKICFVRVRLYWGTTTNSGTGTFYFSLPVSASSTWGIQMPASMLDNGNAWYQATVNGEYGGFTNRTALIGQSAGGANSSQGVTGVFPFTFGNLDSIQFNGSYETI